MPELMQRPGFIGDATYWIGEYSDARTAIFVRFLRDIDADLDPIEVYNEWLTAYELPTAEYLTSINLPTTGVYEDHIRIPVNAILHAMVSSDDDGDYFNFELYAWCGRCFECGKVMGYEELVAMDSYPVCLDCAPQNLDDDYWIPDGVTVVTYRDAMSYGHDVIAEFTG